MARHVLSARLGAFVGLMFAASTAACPHDWSSFDDVPRTAAAPDASSETRDAGTVAPPPSAAALVPFATLGERPALLFADAAGIVFTTNEGSILSCSHDGCSPALAIASQQHDVRALSATESFVAWAARGDHTVRRSTRRPGASALVQAFDDDGLVAVGLGGDRVYFAVDAVGTFFGRPGIRSCIAGENCDGITFASFADGEITDFRIDGADALWLGEGKVFGCRLADCDVDPYRRVVIASEGPPDGPQLTAIASDATGIFWVSTADGGSIRTAARTALAGGAPFGVQARAVAIGLGSVSRIVPTPTSVWFTSSVSGTVSRAPREGGAPEVVARDLAAPTGIAAFGGYVYVTCNGDGRIFRWRSE